MFVLRLNPMTGRAEDFVPVARAETIVELERFIKRERVPDYSDDGRKKCFRQGGRWSGSIRRGRAAYSSRRW